MKRQKTCLFFSIMKKGEYMKVYIDLIIFINFAFDFILLLSVSFVLKRHASLKRITLGAILGGLTLLVLFVPFTTLTLFLMKVVLSILIVIVTFGFKDLKYVLLNLFYFYITSIVLGGFMYYLNVEFSYKNIGMIFYHKGVSINYLFILVFAPIILYFYTKEMNKFKIRNSLSYKVDVYLKDKKVVRLNGFMDTGNTLVEPYNHKKVIVVNSKEMESCLTPGNFMLVPYDSVNSSGFLKCIRVDKLYIDGLGVRTDVVVGLTNAKLKNNGVNCILNYLLMEE